MNHLLNAILKCRHSNGRVWDACLNPKEILALNDLGPLVIKDHDWEIAVYWKRKGISNRRWVVVTANDRFEELKNNARRTID